MQPHLLIYPTYNYYIFIFYQCLSSYYTYCILLKNDSLLPILCFPGYFETPLFQTFLHFPLYFEIAGFNCIYSGVNFCRKKCWPYFYLWELFCTDRWKNCQKIEKIRTCKNFVPHCIPTNLMIY